MVVASDPDILVDFIIPDNQTEVDASFFTYTGARGILDSEPPSSFTVTEVSMDEFPALNGQGVSYSILQYNQTLEVGDIFIFPKGLVHFATNTAPAGGDEVATAISAFGSASAGTVLLPDSIFASNIDDGVLASAFNTNVTIIQLIKNGFQLQ
ncbi:Germin-like protein 9-3 [Linum perenne]